MYEHQTDTPMAFEKYNPWPPQAEIIGLALVLLFQWWAVNYFPVVLALTCVLITLGSPWWMPYIGRKFADWIIWRFDEPYGHLTGYMERFRVMNRSERDLRPYITLHHILRSDHARAQHSHPWAYLSIILRGGYWEYTLKYDAEGNYLGEDRKWYGPGSIVFRTHNHYHRLWMLEGETAWTLFFTFKWKHVWKFMVDPQQRVEVDHDKYPDAAFDAD